MNRAAISDDSSSVSSTSTDSSMPDVSSLSISENANDNCKAFLSLNEDVKRLIISYLTTEEEVILCAYMYRHKEKKLMHLLGRFMIHGRSCVIRHICKRHDCFTKHDHNEWLTLGIDQISIGELNIDMYKFILSMPNIDVNLSDEKGNTALMYACRNGLEEVVDILLRHDHTDINKQNVRGMTALHFATMRSSMPYTHNSEAIIESVIRHTQIDITLKNTRGLSALIYCAAWGHNDPLLTALITLGSDVNDYYEGYGNALTVSINRGHISTALILVQCGCDVGSVNDLILACTRGYHDIVNAMLDAGSDVNAVDRSGRTPLYATITTSSRYVLPLLMDVIVNILLRAPGIQVDIKYKGRTPLFAAVEIGLKDVVIELIKAGANVNTINQDGFSVLHRALSKQHEKDGQEIVDILKQAGALETIAPSGNV